MIAEPRNTSDRQIGFWGATLGLTVILAVLAVTYADVLSYWFVGVDVFPLILSNRLESVAQLPELLGRQYLAAYGGQEISGSTGIRPVGSLLFAVDYWLWGLNPSGYHFTDLSVHAINAVLVFVLARRLGFRHATVVAFLAAILFVRHPLSAASVPLIAGRYDLILTTFTLLFLWSWLGYLDSGGYRDLTVATIFAVLALLSKETAVVLYPIAVLTAATVWAERRRELRQLWLPVVVLIVAFAGYFVYRHAAVGGLGGYPVNAPSLPWALFLALRRFFDPLVYPLPLLTSSFWGQVIATAVTAATTLALLGVFCIGAVHYFTRWYPIAIARIAGKPTREFTPYFLLCSWTLGYLALYGSAYLLTGLFKPLYLYVTSTIWSILLSAVTVHLAVRFSQLARARALRVAVPLLLVVVVTVFTIVGPYRSRVLGTWSSGGEIGRDYIQALEAALMHVPQGATLFLINLPHGVDCAAPPCIGWTQIFEDYSLDSWRRLTMPDRQVSFVAISTVRLQPEEPVVSRAAYDPERAALTVRNRGGRVEWPWHTESGRYFNADIVPMAGRNAEIIVRLRSERQLPTYYFFDFFEPRRLYTVAPDEGIERIGS